MRQSVNGVSVYLTHNSSLLEAIDANPSQPDIQPFTPGDFLPSDTPILENSTSGSQLNYSQFGLIEGNSGQGTIASVKFKALKEGTVHIQFDFDSQNHRETEVSSSEQPGSITPNVRSATVDIVNVTSIPVRVPLANRANMSATVFCQIGQGGVASKEEWIPTDSNGDTVWNISPPLAPGTYEMFAKEWHYLGRKKTNVQIPPPQGVTYEWPNLNGGDCDNSNFINLNDFSILAFFFNKAAPPPASIPPPSQPAIAWMADIDGSGFINLNDFSILAFNFNKGGDPPFTIQASPPAVIAEAGRNQTAFFQLHPQEKLLSTSGNLGVQIGEELEISVIAEQVADLYTYSFEVSYDTSGLKLINQAGIAATEGDFLKRNTGKTPSLFLTREENTRTLIVAGSVTGEVAGVFGSGEVARLHFQIISDAPGTISLSNILVNDHTFKQNLLPSQKLVLRAVPRQTAAIRNYPNPFNPETWMPFQLAEDAQVTIQIYNISGELIRSVSLGQKPAGYYVTRSQAAYWDGRNQSGEFVASGVYFYRLQAGKLVAIQKMILLK